MPPPWGAIDPLEKDLFRLLASTSRMEICDLLRKGVDHPDDLAKRLKVSRQSVDKHLLALHEKGVVERSAVFPSEGRPRVVYALGAAGGALLDRLEGSLRGYIQAKRDELRAEVVKLDDALAAGELDEQVYAKRRKALEKHYRDFLEGA